MKAGLLGSLEIAIEEWAERECYDDGLPEAVYWPDALTQNMARAAAAVFDANINGQVFARKEDGK